MLYRREIYNCSYVNRHVSIYRFLEYIGYFPVKKKGNIYLYHSPFRLDKNPSFYLNVVTNVYHDYGETNITKDNLGFTLIDLLTRLYNISVEEALNRALSFSFSPYQPSFEENESKMELMEVKSLSHPALINYLRNERHINLNIAKKYCVEVHYYNANRRFFAIGFKNISGGYELRNSIDKRTFKPKDISYIHESTDYTRVAVFEGFMDFLSVFSTDFFPKDSSFLVLNGIGMCYKIKEILINYREVLNFLDNDDGGNTGTGLLLGMGLTRCIDMRHNYEESKDVNQHLVKMVEAEKLHAQNMLIDPSQIEVQNRSTGYSM